MKEEKRYETPDNLVLCEIWGMKEGNVTELKYNGHVFNMKQLKDKIDSSIAGVGRFSDKKTDFKNVGDMKVLASIDSTPIRVPPMKEIVGLFDEHDFVPTNRLVDVLMKHVPYKRESAETSIRAYLKYLDKAGNLVKERHGNRNFYSFSPRTVDFEKKDGNRIVMSDGRFPLTRADSVDRRSMR